MGNRTLKTAGQPVRLGLRADRRKIKDDGADLAFITVKVLDKDGNIVPIANNKIVFSISGPAEIVATDNGDPADLVAFPSKERKALSGMALVIVRSLKKAAGKFELKAEAENLGSAKIVLSTSANLLDVRHQKITKGIKR